MLRFCEKNKGAISVFLTLILLPTLLLGGLTTDAARIYASKVVISDAGEMAMNAALAQYDEKLLDEYGLFMMSKEPSAMNEDLEKYFNASLNGSGITGAEDYQKILDLVTEEFKTINLEASKIYKTEVEKQQIIEYMKYRAPVCLTEAFFDKLEVLKQTKQITKAMEAQMDFAEDMEECQSTMEDTKEKLDILDAHLQNYPTQNQLQQCLDETEGIYKTDLSKVLLMAAAAKKYNQRADSDDGESAAKSLVQAAEGIDLGDPLSGSSFESCINAKYYKDSAKKLKNVIKTKKEQEPAENAEGYKTWKEEYEALLSLQSDYEAALEKIDSYVSTLKSYALHSCIEPQTNLLTGYYEKTKNGFTYAKDAYDQLEKLEKKLKKAAESWQTWSDETDKIPDSLKEEKQGMQKSVEEYKDFFAMEDGAVNLDNLNQLGMLMNAVETDRMYFNEMKDILAEVKFFDKTLVKTSAQQQMNTYWSKAQSYVGDAVSLESQIRDVKDSYAGNYVSTEITSAYVLHRIENDEFYNKLKEYCKANASEESKAEKSEANKKLEEGKSANANAQKEDDATYPTYQWTLDETMPSVILQKEKENAENTASVDGDVNGFFGRKKAIKAAKNSIKEASNFLTKLDNILTEGISNLYVAEYAMQMFSYYTVDKQLQGNGTVKTLDKENVISLSGYKMADRKAYKAEVEYILWGNEKSQTNIRNTVMTIFGIRLLLNSIFAFTNAEIRNAAHFSATTIAGAAPYLVPVLQAIIQFGFSCRETSDDIVQIKEGYGVAVLKDKTTWKTFMTNGGEVGDNTKGNIKLDYSEYLRIFLNINMLGDLETNKLARIADCIQLNSDSDLTKGYTMLEIEVKVKARTTFMKKISDMGSGLWQSPDDHYSIRYQSVLGY